MSSDLPPDALVLRKTGTEEFTLVSGSESDFEIIVGWYRDSRHKRPIEDMTRLVSLVSVVVDGPEQGVRTMERVREARRELAVLLRECGYEPQWRDV